VRRALLTHVAHLLSLNLELSRFDKTVQTFCAQCDQVVAQDPSTQDYVRQLEREYDSTVDEELQPRRDDDLNPEKLMQELEDFLRQEREGRDNA
jgi:hypothetical protein